MCELYSCCMNSCYCLFLVGICTEAHNYNAVVRHRTKSHNALWYLLLHIICSNIRILKIASLKQTAHLWKLMVGKCSLFFQMAYFQGRTVSYRECISCRFRSKYHTDDGVSTGLNPGSLPVAGTRWVKKQLDFGTVSECPMDNKGWI